MAIAAKIPTLAMYPIGDGGKQFESRIPHNLWFPKTYVEFVRTVTHLPDGWEFLGVNTPRERLVATNDEFAKIFGGDYKFFAILSGDVALCFKADLLDSPVYLTDLYTAAYSPKLHLAAASFKDWLLIAIKGALQSAVEQIEVMKLTINQDSDDSMFDDEIGRVLSKFSLYWLQNGIVLDNPRNRFMWWPARPIEIETTYLEYCKPSEYTKAIPADWHLALPQSRQGKNKLALPPQIESVIQHNSWSVFGSVGKKLLLMRSNRNKIAIIGSGPDYQIDEYETFSQALRYVLADEFAVQSMLMMGVAAEISDAAREAGAQI